MLDFEQIKIIKEQITKDNASEFVQKLIMAYFTPIGKMEQRIEIWRDILNYEGLYQVSNLGRIKSIPHLIKANKDGGIRVTEEHMKTTYVGWHGYIWVALCKNEKSKTYSVHRLVATAFIENKNGLPAVNHIDGNKENNVVENLEWCTNSYNQLHASSHGLFKNTKKVKCIETGKEYRNSCEAERKTGISARTIRNVCSGKGNTAGGYKWGWA